MFRDDAQRGEVCFILCAWVRDSPWRYAVSSYRPHGPVAWEGRSVGELAMLHFAKRLWNGDGEDPAVGLSVWTGFDARRMRDIAELLVAMVAGPEAIDRWIENRSCTMKVRDTVTREAWEADVRERSRA